MITTKEVEHVAKLARLALTPEEKELYAEQLSKIIGYFDELSAVDTSNVEPLAHAQMIVNVMREDEIKERLGRDKLLKNCPDTENGYFKVPRIGSEG